MYADDGYLAENYSSVWLRRATNAGRSVEFFRFNLCIGPLKNPRKINGLTISCGGSFRTAGGPEGSGTPSPRAVSHYHTRGSLGTEKAGSFPGHVASTAIRITCCIFDSHSWMEGGHSDCVDSLVAVVASRTNTSAVLLFLISGRSCSTKARCDVRY